MTAPSDFSLASLQKNPKAQHLLEILSINNHESFVTAVYKALDRCIRVIEQSRHVYHTYSEDQLTCQIVGMLKMAGFDASHATNQSGHVDLFVEYEPFSLHAEAKIHQSYTNVLDGFRQLCNRYTDGRKNSACGALIIYIKRKKALEIIDDWERHLNKCSEFADLSVGKCKINPDCLWTTHTHDVSGRSYSVRHVPVLLNFEPTDASARKSASRRKK